MKKIRLLLLMSAGLLGLPSAQAQQTWTEPTVNTTTFNEGDTVYFFNVKTKLFLTEGNAYNTQTSLGTTGTAFAPKKNEDGTWLMIEKAAISNGTKTSTGWSYMFIDKYTTYPGTSFMDEGTQARDHWTIFDMGNNIYQIAPDTANIYYGEEILGKVRFGWDGGNNTVVYPILDVSCDTASVYGVDWQAVKVNDTSYTKFAPLTALSAAMKKAMAINIDFSKYLTVYNNSNATADEINAAAKELVSVVANAGIAGATYENPKDATAFLADPDCSSTTLTGWTQDPVSSWAYQKASYTNGDVVISQFIEKWIKNGTLPDVKLYQSLSSMPSGSYRLGADVNAANQTNNKDNETGTFFYAETTDGINQIEVSTSNGFPEHVYVDFTINDGNVTLGYKTVNTSCNWICIDNVTLTYYGNGNDAIKATLKNNIQNANTAMEQPMNESYYDKLQSAIEKAQITYNNASASIDIINAQIADLQTAIKDAKANVDAYASLQSAIDSANIVLDYDTEKYTTYILADYIVGNGVNDALTAFTYNTTDCNAIIDSIYNKIQQVIYSAIHEGNDITFVLANPNFTGNNINGWTGIAPTTNYKCAEYYQKTFDLNQTLTDLPNGKYTLEANAFMRTAANDVAYNDYKAGTAKVNTEIYANDNATAVCNVMAQAQATSIMNDSLGTTNDYQNSEGTYTPNSLEGSSVYFLKGFYNNTVSAIVTNGTLKLGIRLIDKSIYGSGYWVSFDNFRLIYDGKSINVLTPLRDETIANAEALYTSPMCTDSLTALQNAVNIAKAETDGDKLLIEIVEINKAKNAANNSINTYSKLVSYMAYAKLLTDSLKRPAAAADYTTVYAAIQNKIEAGNYQDSEIADALIAAKTATNKYLMSEVNKASEINPLDVTYTIQNADFSKNNSNGWDAITNQTDYAGATAYQCYEMFNHSFDFAQKLYGMPAGTYKLTAQGFYRDGVPAGLADSIANNRLSLNAKLYLNDATVKLMSITEAAIDTTGSQSPKEVYAMGDGTFIPNSMQTAAFWFDSLTIGQKYITNEVIAEVKSNGTITIGIKKDKLVTSDWTMFGGFKLYYLGISSDISNIVDDSQIVNSKYYDISGKENSRLIKGVNIVKHSTKNGITIVKKIVVR